MAELTVQIIARTGLEPTFAAAAAGGDTFVNDGRTFLWVKNADVDAMNVTINSLDNCDQGFDHDPAVEVTNAEERLIGPFPTGRFNDSSGQVSVTYDDETSVTVAVVKLPLT